MAAPRRSLPSRGSKRPRSFRSPFRRALTGRPKTGFARTDMRWRYDMGPINPKADQPANDLRYLGPPRAPAPRHNDDAYRFSIERRIHRGQGPLRRQKYRKTTGRRRFIMPPGYRGDRST